MSYEIADISLAPEGLKRLLWADRQMPVLGRIRQRFERERPLEGLRIALCLHVTTESANLVRTLAAGGAKLRICASNPLSTHDDVAASLVSDYEIEVFACCGESRNDYYRHLVACLEFEPHLIIDDGADLCSALLFASAGMADGLEAPLADFVRGLSEERRAALIGALIGSTEETSTGILRLEALEREVPLRWPVIAVNEARTHLFDSTYGTGQSTIDGVLRASNILLAGSTVVIAGYGNCGRGIARCARGQGARVIVCEVDPVPALQAAMDGFEVQPMSEAAKRGDLFITSTGTKHVIDERYFASMRDGAMLANAGHFDVEIDVEGLRRESSSNWEVRPLVRAFRMKDGCVLYLLASGRLVNLASAHGHPAGIIDLPFANHALAIEILATERHLEPGIHSMPRELDRHIAEVKLETMGVQIDSLNDEQRRYLSSWQPGT